MNLSYILNDQGNPIPISEKIINRIQMQNGAQGTGNGTYANIDGCGLIVLQVTGTFVATIKMQVDDSSNTFSTSRDVTAVDTSDGSVVTAITKPGIYEIRNTIGVTLRARVNSYTSGSVTVNGTVIKTDIQPEEPILHNSIERFNLQNEQSGTGNGTSINIDGYGLIVLKVTGTFVGKIRPQMFDDAAQQTSARDVSVINSATGEVLDRITEAGIYEIRNTIGMQFRARVDAYTSGSITVDATLIDTDVEPVDPDDGKTHHKLIGSFRNQSVAAEGTKFILAHEDISKYMFLYLHIYTDESHPHTVYYTQELPQNLSIPGNAPVPINILVTEAYRVCSDWIEIRSGTAINMAITNQDTESAHVYDIDIYGVM